MALLHLARLVVEDMIEAGGGAILRTGNTPAYRGKSKFAGFAASKAAQRILIESIVGEVFHIAHQPRSAWSNEIVIRPFGETW